MAVNLIPSSFITDDDKKLSVVDVYTETKEQISNSVFKQVDVGLTTATTVTNEVKGELVKSITAVKGVFNDKPLPFLIKDIAQGKFDVKKLKSEMGVLDKAAAIAKLKSAINPNLVNDVKGNLLKGVLNGVGFTGDSDALVKGILGLPGGKTPINVLLDSSPKLKVLYDANTVIKSAKDINDAKGVASLLTSLSGNSELAKVLDMESQFATMSSIMQVADEWNAPELIDKTVDFFEDINDKYDFSMKNIKKAIKEGSMKSLRRIRDVVGAEAIMQTTPQAIYRILAGYRIPSSMKTLTLDEANHLNDLLNSLNPNWFQYQRNGVWISNLEPFQVASADAVKVFKLLGLYTVEIAIAKTYPKTNLIALSKKRYPKAGL